MSTLNAKLGTLLLSASILNAQIGVSDKIDRKLIDLKQTKYHSVSKFDNFKEGTYVFKDRTVFIYSRNFSDHPSLFAQEFVPGDFYDPAKYKAQVEKFLKLALNKNDFEFAMSKIKLDKFNTQMEFNLDHPTYSEFSIVIRIHPRGMNLFLTYSYTA
jgi:hypothetical protein